MAYKVTYDLSPHADWTRPLATDCVFATREQASAYAHEIPMHASESDGLDNIQVTESDDPVNAFFDLSEDYGFTPYQSGLAIQ